MKDKYLNINKCSELALEILILLGPKIPDHFNHIRKEIVSFRFDIIFLILEVGAPNDLIVRMSQHHEDYLVRPVASNCPLSSCSIAALSLHPMSTLYYLLLLRISVWLDS